MSNEKEPIVKIIEELKESYESYINENKDNSSNIEKWIQDFKSKHNVKKANIDIYFYKAWGAGIASLDKLNILFTDRSNELYYYKNKRTTGGYYIIISDLDKDKVNLRIDFSNFLARSWYGEEKLDDLIKKYIYIQSINDLKNEGIIFKYISETKSEYTLEVTNKIMEYIEELKLVINHYPEIMKRYLKNNSELDNKYSSLFIKYKENKKSKQGELFTKYIWSLVYNERGIEPNINNDIEILEDKENSQFDSEKNNKTILNNFSKNTILYGPPGTGKTYYTKIYAVWLCNYKDKPLKTVEDMAKDNIEKLNEEYENLIKENRIKFTTFHQSYGYEDFIVGIRPDMEGKGESKDIKYRVQPGVFKKFCDEINSNENYVFIIDEINRGNISKIFGELITAIEEDKRGKLSITLPYGNEELNVPENLYIIGTMNTADRSIALMDTALRRRFEFIEKQPNAKVLEGIEVDGINVEKLLNTINSRIEVLYDKEHTIGHAYFIELKESKTIETLGKIFKKKIIPLLQEYFYDDYKKIQYVLGEAFVEERAINSKDIFGKNIDDEIPESMYVIKDGVFNNKDNYIKIYTNNNDNEEN